MGVTPGHARSERPGRRSGSRTHRVASQPYDGAGAVYKALMSLLGVVHRKFIAVCDPRLRVIGLADWSEDLALAGSEQGDVHLRGRRRAKGKNEPVCLTAATTA